MSNYLNYNGQQIKSDTPVLTCTNRAFCYGDGVFETIRCLNSQPLFFDKHYQRLRNALYHLQIELNPEYTENYFRIIIQNLLQRNRIYKGARARLTVFRNEGGYYTPSHNSSGFLLTVDSISAEKFQLNQSGLHVDIYRDILKPVNFLSQFKTSSALMFVMAGLWKKEQNLDDCLILNQSGLVTESLASNIFLVKNGKLITPSVESGCVDGTMRRTILEISSSNQIPVIESEGLKESHLLSADEAFVTNAIAGVNWISAYKDKRYFHTMASRLVAELNNLVDKEIANGLLA
jgi:branched-chain amino acid aminotransferase